MYYHVFGSSKVFPKVKVGIIKLICKYLLKKLLMAGESSRLLVSGDAFRSALVPRNLYNLDNEYEVSGNLSLRNKGRVADSIASILSVIPQWQKINPANSLISRALPNQSPLAQIGTIMLAQQLFYNSASHIAQQNLPSIDLGQALQGKNPFIKNINYSITDKEPNSFLDKVGGFISKSFFETNSIGKTYPFSEYSTNSDFIKNTGKGQLTKFYQAINMNVYKQISSDNTDTTFINYSKIANVPISDRNTSIQARINVVKNPLRIYFDFDKNPYWKYGYGSMTIGISVENANFEVTQGYINSTNSNTTQEYYPNIKFIEDNFGKTNLLNEKTDMFNYVKDVSNLTEDSVIKNKLVWGRDSLGMGAYNVLSALHGDTDEEKKNLGIGNNEDIKLQFKVKTGLLEYTRNLLNATEGNFVDITRKVFKEGNNVVGFNGSPLWKANESTYSVANRINGKTGVRQHTMLDQYDRFAKAIRFNGNTVYNGNTNSVIYNSVLPRIHPTNDVVNNKNVLNNKNMMFSLENLALNVIKRDGYAVIDDEWGSAIPLSEAGPFNGRIMWFPPYDLQINETATAKYEATVMVGRNEPMYNYMNSERGATLTFTLLVDYPEQLRNYLSTSNDKNKAIAEFFAFGGDPLPPEQKIDEYRKQITDLENSKPKITGPVATAEPAPIDFIETKICFPNDMPVVGEENTIIDTMYNKLHYEIIKGCLSAQDGNGFGLNDKIYFLTGLTQTAPNIYFLTQTSFSQYYAGGVNGKADEILKECQLNKYLKNVFSNIENRKYFKIFIDGSSSKLYLTDNEAKYNQELGQRRIVAAAKLVKDRLKAIFGDNITTEEINNIVVENISTGSEGKSPAGALAKNISLKEVKEERCATINIKRTSNPPEPKIQPTNQKQKDDIKIINDQIQALEEKIAGLKNIITDNILNERKIENGRLLGYESVSGNYYYPAFHSQTPEDFHRRLTFLQQCTRQGSAKHYNVVDKNGELRARNSVFGRQPICILRVGDFFYTKIIIETVTIDYNETTWDMNPEGLGMQPMIAKVTLQMKVIGGQSLKGPIDALQNAASFNYYANSTFKDSGMYSRPTAVADAQDRYMNGVNGEGGILSESTKKLTDEYDTMQKQNTK